MNRSDRRRRHGTAETDAPGDAFDRAFRQAIAQESAGRTKQAVRAYRGLIAKRPDAAAVRVRLGVLLGSTGDLLAAAVQLEEAARLAPDDAYAHHNLGNVYALQGRPRDAAAAFRRVLDLAPDMADAWLGLGGALKDAGEVDDAVAALERAVRAAPDLADAHFLLGMLRYDAADPEPAARALADALRHAPGHQRARFFLGMVRDQQGDANAARFHFDRLRPGPDGRVARLDSWAYVKAHRGPETRLFSTTFATLADAFARARPGGLVLEFGVRFATSLNFIAGLADGPVHGFDTFTGLPGAWGDEAAGTYTTGGALPPVAKNVSLHPGLFAETLPGFLAAHDGPVRFVNMDCDLYESTRSALDAIGPRLGSGSVIVFDEYLMHDNWREDEYRAFQEAVRANGWTYDYVAFAPFTKQAAIRLR